ncbi:MAG: hypothetical protein R3A10_10890 [Caldilineaceae bacterium]
MIPTNGTTLYIPLTYNYYHAWRRRAFGTQMYGYSGFDPAEWGVERKRRNLDPAMNWPGAVSNRKTQRHRRTITGTPWRVRWLAALRTAISTYCSPSTLHRSGPRESTNGPIYADNLDDFAEYVGAVVERLTATASTIYSGFGGDPLPVLQRAGPQPRFR